MTITVVDEAGRLVLTARGDGTGFFSPETSRAKAMAAASFKKRTAELAELVAKGGFWSIVPTILQGQILPMLGGSPIMRVHNSEGWTPESFAEIFPGTLQHHLVPHVTSGQYFNYDPLV